MRIGVNARAMEPENSPVVMEIIGRMTANGLDPLLTERMAEWLKEHGHSIPWATVADDALTKAELELCVSLGGDGTLLDTVALVGRSETPVLGINLGRLGFLSNVRLDTMESALVAIRTGRYAVQDRSCVEVMDQQELLGTNNFAMNEVSIHKQDSASMIAVHVHLGADYLNTYWADGLIIATPTGSTAYSLSCGGPVVYPTSDALVINPICPHNLNVRPFVVPDHYTIRLQLEARADRCMMNLDSRSASIDGQSTITIQRAKFSVKMVQFEDSDFLDTLRTKLSWGLDVRSSAPKG